MGFLYQELNLGGSDTVTHPSTNRARRKTTVMLLKINALPSAPPTSAHVAERVKFNVTCLVSQSLSEQVSLYLADNCCLVSDSTRALYGQLTFRLAWCHEHSAVNGDRTFYSRGTSPVELSSGPAVQSRHHLRTVHTTAEMTPFSGSMNTVLCDF